ncbi:MAG TPA: HEPN domain-containing protein [Solirubrobacteraceae bacterium]|jgi:HEPN domain-containing protein
MSNEADVPQVLLGLARDDELAARSLLPVEGVTDAILGFHSQQAVEKSLKAVLAHRGVEFPFTHDLDGLLELCQGSGIDVPEELSDVDHLSPYGVQLRYGTVRPSILDRDQALRRVCCWLGGECHRATDRRLSTADIAVKPFRVDPL